MVTFEKVFEDYTNGVGINISGISLSTALYFLDRDIPFAACIDDGRYVLVISYNSTHIRYYDPVLGAEVKVTRKAFENSLSYRVTRCIRLVYSKGNTQESGGKTTRLLFE